MRRALVRCAVTGCAYALAACGDDAFAPDAAITDAPGDAPPCLPTATHPLQITAGAFPPNGDHPNVLVHIPDAFDRRAPVDVVVYIHGFRNCVENVLGEVDQACTTGGAIRSATHLAAQLDASGKNALLVLPEVAYDEANGDPGKLGTAGGFRALLDESLAALPPPLGPIAPSELGRVFVAVHSGGYRAVASMITIGDVPVDEVWLFDSLYGLAASYDEWIQADLPALATLTRRFANFYTSTGGTQSNSEAMADRAATWVDASTLVDDRTTATWPDATYAHGLLFKRSALTHDGIPRYYFERMLATSPLAARACE